jgi:hypothetical protein
LRGQFQARIVDLLGGHENGAAAFGKLVLDAQLVQRRGDGTAVAVRVVGKQDLVLGWLVPHVQGHADGNQCRHTQAAQEILAHRRLGERLHGLHGRAGRCRFWRYAVHIDFFGYSHDCLPGRVV